MRGESNNSGTDNFQVHDAAEKTMELIPVIQEEIHVEKTLVEKGKILIHKTIQSEEKVIEIPLTQEEYKIERVSVNQYVENPPSAIRYEEETMIIPVIREVYEKRLLLVEEIRVTRQVKAHSHKEKITVRSEDVRIERKENS